MGHRQRVKDRYKKEGLENFQDYEILELILFYAYPRVDTEKIAKKFINIFGSLENILNADIKEIMNKCDTTENVAVLISLFKEVKNNSFKNTSLNLDNSKSVGLFAMNFFEENAIEEERFYLLIYNDNKYDMVLVSKGNDKSVNSSIKSIIKEVVNYNCNRVVLIHNHPSGLVKPSKEDIESTRLIKDALEYVEVDVIDHIIVSINKYCSFREIGLIN